MAAAEDIVMDAINKVRNSAENGKVRLLLHGDEKYSSDWLKCYRSRNDSIIEDEEILKRGAGFTQSVLNFMFITSDRLNIALEIAHVAIEIYDRFYPLHLSSLRSLVSSTEEWTDVKERVMQQIPLRLLSCMQIAMKVTDGTVKALQVHEIVNALNEFGLKFDEKGVRASEIRVLNTLKFKVIYDTPNIYIHVLLLHLSSELATCSFDNNQTPKHGGYQRPLAMVLPKKPVDLNGVHKVAKSLVDLLYNFHNKIYGLLFVSIYGKVPSADQRLIYKQLEFNYMLSASSVILASHYLLDPNATDIWPALPGLLADYSQQKVQYIVQLAQIITNINKPNAK